MACFLSRVPCHELPKSLQNQAAGLPSAPDQDRADEKEAVFLQSGTTQRLHFHFSFFHIWLCVTWDPLFTVSKVLRPSLNGARPRAALQPFLSVASSSPVSMKLPGASPLPSPPDLRRRGRGNRGGRPMKGPAPRGVAWREARRVHSPLG